MPSSTTMSDNNVDNYDEGWYQDDSGNWLNQFNWIQDEHGEWYYDESYYPAGGSGSEYEGWIQDENGEWIEDPNYDPSKGSNKGANSESSAKTQNETTQKVPNSSTGALNGDVSNQQKQNKKDTEQNGLKKSEGEAATAASSVTIKDSTEKKLPPRPADYDYYWYQDEDGNWRNEYDDYG